MSLPKEVSDLLDQAKQSNSILQSMDIHYNALATLIGKLQTSINNLKAGAVLSDADKAALVAETSDLAAVATTASADIATNTPLEGITVDPPAAVLNPAPTPAPAPAPTPAADPATPVNDSGTLPTGQ